MLPPGGSCVALVLPSQKYSAMNIKTQPGAKEKEFEWQANQFCDFYMVYSVHCNDVKTICNTKKCITL
jgi:hypothetical protein